MNIKLQVFLRNIKREFRVKWHQILEPLNSYLSKIISNIYERQKDSITEPQAIKWIAEDTVKYIVKYNRSIHLIVADYIDRDDLPGYECLNRRNWSMIRRKKTIRAYYKFKMTVELQERVLNKLRTTKGVKVERLDVYYKDWQRIDNYQGTYKISIEGSKE